MANVSQTWASHFQGEEKKKKKNQIMWVQWLRRVKSNDWGEPAAEPVESEA